MATNRLQAGARTAHHPPHQRELRDRLHSCRAVEVVRHAHRPGKHGPLAGGILSCHVVDLPLRYARRGDDVVPGKRVEPRGERGPSMGVFPQKLLVDDRVGRPRLGCMQFPKPLHQSVDERQVAPHVRLHIRARDLGAKKQRPRIAGHREVDEPCLDDWIDNDHLAAAAADHHECPHHPRMIARGVATDQEHAVGMLHVVERDGARARANHACEPYAAGLVAVEAAVVDVIGAIEPGEELQEKARFVAGTAAEIEERLLRCGPLQLCGDPFHRLCPLDRPIVLRTPLENHRLHEPAGMLHLMGRERPQLRH